MSQRPARPEGESNSIMDMLDAGRLSKDPSARIDRTLYDPTTNKPIDMGNTDPAVIGPDDHIEYSYRNESAYPEVPTQVKNAEVKFILPLAQFLANTIGITVIDETLYEKIILPLRSRSLFVVLNMHKVKVVDGIASWYGLVLMCKRHFLTFVRFKMKLSTEQILIDEIRLWRRDVETYVRHAPTNGKFFSREEASALILNYLKEEGVLPHI